ncbi:MAG: hypothetical protein ACRDB9_07670 [Cetobacterium sp.]
MDNRIDSIKAVKALDLVKGLLSTMGIEHWCIIPESKTLFMTAPGDVRLHIDVVEFKNQYILKIEELEVNESNGGLGSLILYIITKACELYKCKCGLWVRRGNKVAIDWYLKCGFKKLDRKSIQNDLWLEKSFNKQTDYFKNRIGDDAIEAVDGYFEIKMLMNNN